MDSEVRRAVVAGNEKKVNAPGAQGQGERHAMLPKRDKGVSS